MSSKLSDKMSDIRVSGERSLRGGDGSTTVSGAPNANTTAKSRANGPRTAAGKRRSSRNAVRHGVFVGDTVLPTESIAGYEAFRRDIFEERDPRTASEIDDAEHEVNVRWRRRRLARIEQAQFAIAMMDASKASSEQWREAWDRSQSGESTGGLLRYRSNPYVAQLALDFLKTCRGRIEKFGFGDGIVDGLMLKLFGVDHDGTPSMKLGYAYDLFSKRAASNPPANARTDDADEDQKTEFLKALDEQMEILERCKSSGEVIMKFKGLAALLGPQIPCSGVMDSIGRHEAHLSREIRHLEELWRRRREERLKPPAGLKLP
jgi:hypothetical protein